MFRQAQPEVDEQTLMYRNPLGVKGGRNKILLGAAMIVIAALLVVIGVYYIGAENVGLGVVLIVVSVAYLGLAASMVLSGIKMKARPYAVIIDGTNLILREKNGYLHLPLKNMRRLTIDCEGIDAYLNVNADGEYDVLIKGSNMYYTVDGVQNCIVSRNMRKIAFILNSVALNSDSSVNWGARFDELLSSAQVADEGVVEGLNKDLDNSAKLSAPAAEKSRSQTPEGEGGPDETRKTQEPAETQDVSLKEREPGLSPKKEPVKSGGSARGGVKKADGAKK